MMKIEFVKAYLVEGSRYNWTLVKIETDTGLHGWGKLGTGLPISEVDR